MFKFNSIKRIGSILFGCVIFLGISTIYSSGAKSMEDNTSSTRVYPTRIALTLCKNLSDTISLNDNTTSKAYRTLREFNKDVRSILIEDEDKEKSVNDFHTVFPEVLTTLNDISKNSSFSEKSKHISSTIEPELRKLFEKSRELDDVDSLKKLLQQEVPSIAVKEFLDRNSDLKQRSTKCEDCGFGYFRRLKKTKGPLSLECQLCHHHQNSGLTLTVVTFVESTKNQEPITPEISYKNHESTPPQSERNSTLKDKNSNLFLIVTH